MPRIWTTRVKRFTRGRKANDPSRHEPAHADDASRDPQSGVARAAIHTLQRRGERLIVVPQNLYEFWAVATRPAGPPPGGRNGLGMTTVQAGHWLRFFRRRFTLLPDREELSTLWQELVERHVIIREPDGSESLLQPGDLGTGKYKTTPIAKS